jgi:hypothetical protein
VLSDPRKMMVLSRLKEGQTNPFEEGQKVQKNKNLKFLYKSSGALKMKKSATGNKEIYSDKMFDKYLQSHHLKKTTKNTVETL